ncbi:MAG: NUDIX domain-containing protein, partial [Oscillospiraceae bacterium]|nr:NUDIX domain-containing protein [Oscillospiraceae bacterium]
NLCLARIRGRVAELPVKTPPKARRIEQRTVLLLRWGDRWAVRRREARGLLAGLWEYPNVLGSLTGEQAMAWVREQGAEPLTFAELGEAVHVFSHVEWHMRGIRVDCARPAEGFQWRSGSEIAREYSIPTAFRFYHRQVLGGVNDVGKA